MEDTSLLIAASGSMRLLAAFASEELSEILEEAGEAFSRASRRYERALDRDDRSASESLASAL